MPSAQTQREFGEFSKRDVQRMLAELARRNRESLALWEPIPVQEAFHASKSYIRLLLGGNRSGKEQPIDEPVLTPSGWVEIGSLKVGDAVIGGDGRPCLVTGVFPQGVKPVFRLTFSDGAQARCGEQHLWKCKVGSVERSRPEWHVRSLLEIRRRGGDNPPSAKRTILPQVAVELERQDLPIDPYLLGALLGDGYLGCSVTFATADQEMVDNIAARLPPGMRVHKKAKYEYALLCTSGRRNPLVAQLRKLGLIGKRAHDKFIPPAYKLGTSADRLAILRGLMDTDGTACETNPWFCTTSIQLASDVVDIVRSLGGRAKIHVAHEAGPRRVCDRICYCRKSWRVVISLDMNPFLLGRKAAKARLCSRPRTLRKIEPDGAAECVCIAVDNPDHTYVTRDYIVTHNTATSAVEMARCVLGLDPYNKYEAEGAAIVVAKDADVLGTAIYSRLFKEGLFYIIRDESTGLWRAAHPWDPEDQARRADWKLSDPLIPERYIEDIAWMARNKEQPELIKFRTPRGRWSLRCFVSGSDPKPGAWASLVWLDEEAANPRWPLEMRARLMDTGGRLMWSATPEHSTQTLMDWYQLAMKEDSIAKTEPNHKRRFSAFHINTATNPFKDKEAIEDFYAGTSQADIDVKVKGIFSLSKQIVFSDWDPNVGLVNGFDIPAHWTRYIGIDPGWRPSTVLWMAVPPPAPKVPKTPEDFFDAAHQGKVYIYRELVINEGGCEELARRIKEANRGEQIERFILDFQFARQHEHGPGETRLDQYERAFEEHGLESIRQGPRFTPGSNKPEVRREAIHRWIRHNKLQIFKGAAPALEDDLRRHHYIRDRRGMITDRVSNHGTIDVLGYLAEYDPPWRPPPERKETKNISILDKLRRKQQVAKSGLSFGPGGAKP